MARAKVKPTQLTRRPDRQGSIPKKAKGQSTRKRGEKEVVPVESRPAPSSARTKGQRATSILDESKARKGVRGSKTRGAKLAKHRKHARTPSLGTKRAAPAGTVKTSRGTKVLG